MHRRKHKYKMVAIGASAGGLAAVSRLLSTLREDCVLSIVIVQHRTREQQTLLEELLQKECLLPVEQAGEKIMPGAGKVYVAPPDYHLLIERDMTFSLSIEEYVQYSRPSVDVLFESAADAFGDELVGIVLTGLGRDGAAGIKAVNQQGGISIAQHPLEALYRSMPVAAIESGAAFIYTLDEIGFFLSEIS